MNLQLRRARLEFYQYQVKLKKIIKNQILVLGAQLFYVSVKKDFFFNYIENIRDKEKIKRDGQVILFTFLPCTNDQQATSLSRGLSTLLRDRKRRTKGQLPAGI